MPIVDVTDLTEIGIDPHILRPSNAILPGLAHQRELIDAAIAVNEAPTVAGACQVLADTGAALLDCERFTVVAWNEELSLGTICADTGSNLGELVSATGLAAENLRTQPVYSGPPR